MKVRVILQRALFARDLRFRLYLTPTQRSRTALSNMTGIEFLRRGSPILSYSVSYPSKGEDEGEGHITARILRALSTIPFLSNIHSTGHAQLQAK